MSSGCAEKSEPITGTPHACASIAGIPNPSPIDGCNNTSNDEMSAAMPDACNGIRIT